MAEHQVGLVGDHVGQPGQVALDAGDPVGDVALGRPPAQRGERVGAGVDHGDLVALLGEPDREPAGAAADVDDPATRCAEHLLHGVPDHGGPDGGAAFEGAVPFGVPVGGRAQRALW